MATIFDRLKDKLGDRYELERELGQGGMATVYLAKDLRHDREVAIKVLHPELSASIGAERFEREIKLSAKLQHPHILGLIDSGQADGLHPERADYGSYASFSDPAGNGWLLQEVAAR